MTLESKIKEVRRVIKWREKVISSGNNPHGWTEEGTDYFKSALVSHLLNRKRKQENA